MSGGGSSEGLRQRPGKGADPAIREEYLHTAAANVVPEAAKPYLAKVIPVVVIIWSLIEAAIPHLVLAKAKLEEVWAVMQPYHPTDLLPALVGLAMVFFGGSFPVLIATVVAFQETGTWAAFERAWLELFGELKAVAEQSKADDARDDDGDGTPDVQQIAPREVVQRKLLLVARTVDPAALNHSLTTMSAGTLAVVASLKLTFARTLSLGSSLGNTLLKPASRRLTPVLKAAVDPEFHKWIQPAIAYGCKAVAVSLAFWLQRIISAVHSAINGGQMFTTALCRYLNKNGVISFDPDNSNLDEMAGYIIAAVGLYFQLFYGTPFLLSLLLTPFTISEWIIKFWLSFA